MDRICEDCGEGFGTLSALRLHDCPVAGESENYREPASDGEQTVDIDEAMADVGAAKREEIRQAQRRSSTELTEAFGRLRSGEPGAVHEFLAYYERHLAEEFEREGMGCHWGFHRHYYEPAANAIDDIVRSEGWAFLADVLEAYWPTVSNDFRQYRDDPEAGGQEASWWDYPHVSHVLTNVTGRYTVRTRISEGVAVISSRALAYLRQFHANPDDMGAWVDSMTYGWGIDHPDHSVGETVDAVLAGGYEIWASGVLEHAIHADQHAAIDCIERAVDNDPLPHRLTLFGALGRIDRGEPPEEPRFWDPEDGSHDFGPDGFEWDSGVKARLRSVVETMGVYQDLPEDWSFEDIEP